MIYGASTNSRIPPLLPPPPLQIDRDVGQFSTPLLCSLKKGRLTQHRLPSPIRSVLHIKHDMFEPSSLRAVNLQRIWEFFPHSILNKDITKPAFTQWCRFLEQGVCDELTGGWAKMQGRQNWGATFFTLQKYTRLSTLILVPFAEVWVLLWKGRTK